jgi:hypothetical protein
MAQFDHKAYDLAIIFGVIPADVCEVSFGAQRQAEVEDDKKSLLF